MLLLLGLYIRYMHNINIVSKNSDRSEKMNISFAYNWSYVSYKVQYGSSLLYMLSKSLAFLELQLSQSSAATHRR